MSNEDQQNPEFLEKDGNMKQSPEVENTDVELEDLYLQLQKDFTELQNKHAEVYDAFVRAKAEVENIRRRATEEESKARKFAIESFAKSLLPVKDSLEAALNTPNQTFEALNEGVQTTLNQLISTFESNKLHDIAPKVGDKLDPHLHQAIAVVPSPDHEPNTIVEVLQKGYTIAERVLRPAMVIVATSGEKKE